MAKKNNYRKDWQDFKKKHPAFEKSKLFKSDVGPMMDKLTDLEVECCELRDKLVKKAKELLANGKAIDSAMKGYEGIAEDIQKSGDDPAILSDFKRHGYHNFYKLAVAMYENLESL
jgi:hypothetical protein